MFSLLVSFVIILFLCLLCKGSVCCLNNVLRFVFNVVYWGLGFWLVADVLWMCYCCVMTALVDIWNCLYLLVFVVLCNLVDLVWVLCFCLYWFNVDLCWVFVTCVVCRFALLLWLFVGCFWSVVCLVICFAYLLVACRAATDSCGLFVCIMCLITLGWVCLLVFDDWLVFV